MKPSVFVGITSWGSILFIVNGVLLGIVKNELTTWLLFVFLCVTGLLVAASSWERK